MTIPTSNSVRGATDPAGTASRIARWLRLSAVAGALTLGACASYPTPGGGAPLPQAAADDAAALAVHVSALHAPLRLAVVRVQAPGYVSYSAQAIGGGAFSVLPAAEPPAALAEPRAQWPGLGEVVTIGAGQLPAPLDTLDALRLAAAKRQADLLLVYSIDTVYHAAAHDYAPQSKIPLSLKPDDEASVAASASARLLDVRSGFVFASADALKRRAALAGSWGTPEAIDRQRTEIEQQAAAAALDEIRARWTAITAPYQPAPSPDDAG